MVELKKCPQCGAEINPAAPLGLCPQCLAKVAFDQPANAQNQKRRQAPSPRELSAKFPELEILELLGQGGMGDVYKARQPGLDRLVALKVLPTEIAADPAFAEKFTLEARALARLNHPHIISVYDFGEKRHPPDAPRPKASFTPGRAHLYHADL